MIRVARLILPCLFAACLLLSTQTYAAFGVGVTFNDPGAAHTAYYSPIIANLEAAGSNWASHVSGSGTINIEVNFDATLATSTGRSATSGFVSTDASFSYFEQGAAYKIRTGIDLNGSDPDAYLTIGTGYLTSDLWFDPQPANRSGALPGDRVDAYSVFLHELGHILAFNGWLDNKTGAVSTSYLSTFDALIDTDGSRFFFTGAEAMALYGNPVPLTSGNLFHVGNAAPGAGSDLVDDLMNGISLQTGRRYGLSNLDLAMVSDLGLSVIRPVPEPQSLVLMGLGVIMIGWRVRRRACSKPAQQSV